MALAVLTAPQLAGAVVEGRVLLWAHRHGPRRYLVGGLLGLAVALVLGAVSPSAWVLGLALALAGPASGIALSLSEGILSESAPAERERMMTRWTLAGALGDLAAPLLIALVAVWGGGWRWGMVVLAATCLVAALVMTRLPLPAIEHEDENDGDVALVTSALRRPRLLAWLVGGLACAFLDEILVALAALHLRLDLGASHEATTRALMAWSVGMTIGLLITDRVLARTSARTVLATSGIICTLACAAWWWVETPLGSGLVLFAIGLAGAPLFPIATARAYAAAPGKPALVAALSQIFVPFEIGLPWLLGWLADQLGLALTLMILAVQPITLLVLALAAWGVPSVPSDTKKK